MKSFRLNARHWIGLLVLAVCSVLTCQARTTAHATRPDPLTQHERAEHVLNRLAFGPRPGDVERVEKMGIQRWIDQQLHPEHIDDSALQVKLVALPAMQLSTDELIRRFPPPQTIRQLDTGKTVLPADPVERLIYANALANYREQRMKKQESQVNSPATPSPSAINGDANLLRMPVSQRWNALLRMQPETMRPLLQHMKPAERQQLITGMTPEQKEALEAMTQPARVVTEELEQVKLLRAIYSNRQLEEVMTNFWSNHFSIYLRKNGEMPWYLANYERDVIRPYAMGHFEDLLNAVAHSPAMLIYLDNQQSIGPHSIAGMRGAANGTKKASDGLNENYARELMELHTLGVDGGYTQQDVIELAQVLTGWGIEGPQQGYGFQFNERRHEPGTKVVLGHTIQDNGEAEGEEMLHILAESPATARFLSTKLAAEFVSDNPSRPLIDRMAKTYLKTHGDIRQVLRTMFHSPEFWSRDAYRKKLKTPLEFEISALRATDAGISNASALAVSLDRLGMPLYGVQQPNGYSLKADPWLGAEALLNRMNFSLSLTANRVPGVTVQIAQQDEPQLEQVLLNQRVSMQTHEAVLKELNSNQALPVMPAAMAKGSGRGGRGGLFAPPALPPATSINQSSLAAALLLGSPDFQRR